MRKLLSVILCIAAGLLLVSCGHQVPTIPNTGEDPAISFSEDKIPLTENEYIYRQTISPYLELPGADYSYRVQTLSGNLPEGYIADADGWLCFGNDVWTDKSELCLDFRSENGKIKDMVTQVSIRTRKSNGKIEETSSPFKSNRLIGSRISSNFHNGQDTSCGLEFTLQEVIGDIFVDGMYAHHFMFRINLIDANLTPVTLGSWYSSTSMADIRKVILNGSSTPAITPTPANHYTQFECYVVSRSGIEESTRQSVYFRALQGFKPQALIYPQTAAALGDKHFSIVDDDFMYQNELIPRNGNHRNRRLWASESGLQAIWTPDIKLHLQWGYWGEFGQIIPTGTYTITNNPWDPAINVCTDVNTHADYHSRVEYFDLRWDNAPFPSQTYHVNPSLVTHQDGSTWLRIKNLNPQARSIIFSGLSSGMHQLQVCAVDLQNVISDPAIMQINLVPYKPYDQRSGVLIVDDSANNASSPDALVDDFYNAVVPTTFGSVSSIDISSIEPDDCYLNPIMMQNYKGLVWHTDSPSANPKLSGYADALNIYLGNSGRLVLSGTHKLAGEFDTWIPLSDFLADNFGIASEASYGILSASLVQKTFFIGAEGIQSLPDIDLEIDDAINPVIELKEGLSSVTWFNPGMQVENQYMFVCKPVNAGQDPPTAEEYDFYSSKYVGYLKHQGDAYVAVFGFPLSYMEQQQTQAAMQVLLNIIFGTAKHQGRGL